MPNYNNNFPMQYQPYNPQYTVGRVIPSYTDGWQYQSMTQPVSYPQTSVAQPQMNGGNMNNNMVWVQGEAGAKAFVLPNNTTLPLWDSEAQVIYIKSVDANGKPTMTVLDYTDRNTPEQKQEVPAEYVTITQFNELKNQNDALIKELKDQVSDMREKLSDFKPFASNNRKGNNNGKSSV